MTTITPRLKVKQCCDEMNPLDYEVHKDDTITFAAQDDWFNLDNVRFCAWCGKRLITYAEDPTALMKAHEDLKNQMIAEHDNKKARKKKRSN